MAVSRETSEQIRLGLRDAAAVRAEARRVLDRFGAPAGGGHVFNLGHGISQFTNPDHVTAFMEALHDLSPQYHQGIPTQSNDSCPGAKQ